VVWRSLWSGVWESGVTTLSAAGSVLVDAGSDLEAQQEDVLDEVAALHRAVSTVACASENLAPIHEAS
jgi:hypothetical protein